MPFDLNLNTSNAKTGLKIRLVLLCTGLFHGDHIIFKNTYTIVNKAADTAMF